MSTSPTRIYTWVASVGLLLQGAITLAARLVPAFDQAMPMLLHETRMIPSHSLLHIASGLLGFAALRFGGTGPWLFALCFGLFYVALAVAGAMSGLPLGLGLQPFDHGFHAVLGGFGLLAVAVESLPLRAAMRRDR
jgi:hypothetical protein